MITRISAAILLVAAMPFTSQAHAEGDSKSIVDSVILGAFAHEIANDEEDGVDANLEVRFRPFFGRSWAIEFLPTVGATVNLSGDTNAAYAGATARYRLTDSFFVEGFFGLTLHDTDTPVDTDGLDLGCKLLFREGAGLGYQSGKHSLGIYISHASHGGIICDKDENDGMTSLGLRYGYHF